MPLNLDVALSEINTGAAVDGAPIVANGSGGAKMGTAGGSGGGGVTMIEDVDLTSQADYTLTWDDAAGSIEIYLDHLHPVNDSVTLWMLLGHSGYNSGSFYNSNGNYYYTFEDMPLTASPTKSYLGATAGSEIPLSGSQGTGSGQFIAGKIRIADPGREVHKHIFWEGSYCTSGGTRYERRGTAYMPMNIKLNKAKFLFSGSSPTIDAIRLRAYAHQNTL